MLVLKANNGKDEPQSTQELEVKVEGLPINIIGITSIELDEMTPNTLVKATIECCIKLGES